MEERWQAFEAYINDCDSDKEHPQWIGQGNPVADILLIGQEPAVFVEAKEEEAKKIKDNIDFARCHFNTDREKLYCKNLKRADFKGNHTWIEYQKLIDFIYYDKPKEHSILDFGEYAYTTEMNNVLSPTMAITPATRKDFEPILATRRALFKRNRAFIQSFPVTILACGGEYIQNKGDVRQIDDTFGVRFDRKDTAISEKGKEYPFWIHYDGADKKRLLIHCRQLSGRIPDCFLKKMADVISDFL